MDGTRRADIRSGTRVRVVQKQDQPFRMLTDGIVTDIFSESPTHPHGIKVRLPNGVVGRVLAIKSRGKKTAHHECA